MPRSYQVAERLFSIENVKVQYGDNVVIRDINLAIDNIVRSGMTQGQVIALLGPSGCGKTQLMRCISAMQVQSAGSIYFNTTAEQSQQLSGQVFVKPGDVGFVFQHYPLMKHRTVLSNLKLASDGKRDQDIDVYLSRFNLLDKKQCYPSELSGGQRQRIAIIQQMLITPRAGLPHIILMDEPFSGLDVRMKLEVGNVIHEVTTIDERNTIVFTTHDLDMALKLADTIWMLGYEYDAAGNQIPGAVVVKNMNLIDRGLAWNPDAEFHPQFAPTMHELRSALIGLKQL